ncbi:M23 family metallopeptidase [Sphingomonas sp. NFR15]|uniref:M23 family metallopeptidase n=1 Tax=Sphingomonas sp. NFR15 TaxID=1566282 RepID=UPI00088CD40B|nr:M23 family metallopeptidase [Sphingomonas sp. NFR15]SDA36618.1 Murein DD-endopeptidase MepM and murein hydrolase activator NlpD, contain LysM domain [Sphingomonas sp. NFR15]
MRAARTTAAAVLLLGGCATVPRYPSIPAPPPARVTPPPSVPQRPAAPVRFSYTGAMVQGGLVIGAAPAGATLVSVNGASVPVARDGRFVFGFDRDAGAVTTLAATLADGRQVRDQISVAPRSWNISRLASLPKYPVPAPEFARIRPGELAQIAAARAVRTDAQGWRQAFAWPATGRISTLFGSQRIYKNGEAGAYHSGLDIAKPTGSVVLSPADGVVILAADHPFTLEGNLLMIDHGMGLNSAFLHLSRIDVRVGDHVRRGQPIALSGATGRATGPHLHWAIRWRDAKLDPLLVAGPMAGAE